MFERIVHACWLRVSVAVASLLAAPPGIAHGAHPDVPAVAHGVAHLAPAIAAFGSIGLITLVLAIRARRESRD